MCIRDRLSLCTGGKLCPHQTFTSGENHDFYQRTKKGKGKALTPKNFPAPAGVVWHLLLPLSKGWGSGEESRFETTTLKEHIDVINAEGGTITLDVPLSSAGKIPVKALQTLQELGIEVKTDEDKSALLEKERKLLFQKTEIENNLMPFTRSLRSIAFFCNRSHVLGKHLSPLKIIDSSHDTGEVYLKWLDLLDSEDFLLLCYLKDNSIESKKVVLELLFYFQ